MQADCPKLASSMKVSSEKATLLPPQSLPTFFALGASPLIRTRSYWKSSEPPSFNTEFDGTMGSSECSCQP